MSTRRWALSFALALAATPVLAEEVVVRTAAELKAAIGSHRTVILEPGDYVFDHALWVRKVEGLTLRGRDRATTRILGRDSYDNVLTIHAAKQVRVEGLTLGHAPEVAECVGGVLFFEYAKDVAARDLTLFGSGVEGLTFSDVDRARVEDVEIRECTVSAMTSVSSTDVQVSRLTVQDNEVYGGLFNVHSSDVVIEDLELQHFEDDRALLVAMDSIPYTLTALGYRPSRTDPATLTFRGGRVVGKVVLPPAPLPGLRFRGLDLTALQAVEGMEGEDLNCDGLRAVTGQQARWIAHLQQRLREATGTPLEEVPGEVGHQIEREAAADGEAVRRPEAPSSGTR